MNEIEQVYRQFEREAIEANYCINFAKSEGKYFYTITQAMFNGWYLRWELQEEEE